jgi:ATP-dependent DNA helicase DinG
MTMLATTPKTFAEAERVLAETLPNYTPREQQRILAEAVEAVIAHGGQGMFQAGTGTGKSVGYAVPVILSGQRVIIATSTKALQEQLASKDMPFLEENLGVNFTWALLKGRANYLCHQKMSELSEADVPALSTINKALREDPEHSGDIEHFELPEMKNQWNKLTMSSTECPGKSQCPFGEICFSEKARAKAADADVVITNTAMLMTELRVRQLSDGMVRMLGDYDLVVLDEAHELPEIATNALSDDLRSNQIEKLAHDAMSWITGQRPADLTGNDEGTEIGGVTKIVDKMTLAVTELWMKLEGKRGVDRNKRPSKDPVQLSQAWILENMEPFATILDGVRELRDEINGIRTSLESGTRGAVQKQRLLRRCENMATRLTRLITVDDDELVRWLEIEQRTYRGQSEEVLVLKASPVEVGPFLRETLWDVTPTVMVSATLAVGTSFAYMIETLGLEGYNPLTLDVGTPFEYSRQARLFVPAKDAPAPKPGTGWETYAQTTMLELIRAAEGGGLLLFTSRKNMNQAYDAIAPLLENQGIRCFKQGDATNKVLAREFAADTDSCLFALKSFMVGVDFQGDTCRLVVIDKLPFPVPSDILFAAKSAAVEHKHGARSSFSKLSIPMMTLVLTQAFGRLIRHASDAGVVAILDSRLSSTGYGKGIVRNLPKAPVVSNLRQVEEFYRATQSTTEAA